MDRYSYDQNGRNSYPLQGPGILKNSDAKNTYQQLRQPIHGRRYSSKEDYLSDDQNSRRGRAISDERSYRSGSKVKFSGNKGEVLSDGRLSEKSRSVKKSSMTRDPNEQNSFSNMNPNADGRDQKIYKEFDSRGRIDDSFYKKAALAGIKNLDTKSYNNDSSVLKS